MAEFCCIFEREDDSLELESWLRGIVGATERSGGLYDNVSSLLYDPGTGQFSQHWILVNDVSTYEEYIDETDRRVRTIGSDLTIFIEMQLIKFRKFDVDSDEEVVKSQGITWQWLARRHMEGFLYGKLDSVGRFSGDDIIFIYPDMLTGIRGEFRDGELVSGSPVDITGERCNQGLKEIEVKPALNDAHVIWRKEVDIYIYFCDGIYLI